MLIKMGAHMQMRDREGVCTVSGRQIANQGPRLDLGYHQPVHDDRPRIEDLRPGSTEYRATRLSSDYDPRVRNQRFTRSNLGRSFPIQRPSVRHQSYASSQLPPGGARRDTSARRSSSPATRIPPFRLLDAVDFMRKTKLRTRRSCRRYLTADGHGGEAYHGTKRKIARS